MTDQDNLRDRIAGTIADAMWRARTVIGTHEDAAQAIIDELGLTVETAGGYGYGRAPDLKRRPVEQRVVGKWEKQ